MDNNFFISRIEDTASLSQKNNAPKFLGFLTSEEATIANEFLKRYGYKYSFFGGYEDAERVYLACLPDWCESVEYPITALTFTYKKEFALTHRDFLGSIMAFGLAREKIGDILVGEGKTVVFVSKEISKHLASQIVKIGSVGVNISFGYKPPLPVSSVLLDFSSTVSSTRLDCVVSSILGVSRNKATQFIEGGLVRVNSFIRERSTYNVKSGEKITVKGKGKFIIDSLDEITKKGRIILKFKKYV